MNDAILEMRNISKSFPGVQALDGVEFSVRRAEIHCLVGENGAGKSTLMKILSGVHPYGSYEGAIIYEGQEVRFQTIADSEKAGIAIIYQELAQFPELSVYENIFVGHPIAKDGVINWNETINRAQQLLKRVRLDVNPSMPIKHLGVGKRQLIEIAKALSKDVRLLILDEPTAALNDDDSEHLLDLLRELKQQGVTSILISHRLREVVQIADTITVLRDGKTICTLDNGERQVTERDIIRHMVGREIENIYPPRSKAASEETVLDIRDWTVIDPQTGRQILTNINLHVNKGEIVGLAGLMGAGRTELSLSVFGNTPKYKLVSGQISLAGQPIDARHPGDAIAKGLAYVTEDRKRNGLILGQNIRFNLTIAALHKLVDGAVINENKETVEAGELKENMNIRAPSIWQYVRNLSGGNQQKTSVAKWLYAQPRMLILDEPTRGIDVGAKFEIYTLMNRLVEEGMSILMISSELLEVLGMSDRIYVMSEGTITGELPASEASEQKIMALATRTLEDSP